MSRKSDGEQGGNGDKGYDRGTTKALALATQLGLSIALPMVVFIAAGVWADNQFGTKPWLFFVGLALGIGSAGAAFYQIATALPTKPYKPPEKKAPSASDKTPPPEDEPLWGEYDPDDDWATDDGRQTTDDTKQ